MLQRLFVALAVMLVLGGCAKPPYTSVDNAQLKTLLAQGVPIYDVRRAEEWQQTGVVEGSRTLTWVDNSGQPNPEFLPQIQQQASTLDMGRVMAMVRGV